jgi:predicted DNA-binding transcriptional regulator AlpA
MSCNLISAKESAVATGYALSTIHQFIRMGKFPLPYNVDGQAYFSAMEVAEWNKERKQRHVVTKKRRRVSTYNNPSASDLKISCMFFTAKLLQDCETDTDQMLSRKWSFK